MKNNINNEVEVTVTDTINLEVNEEGIIENNSIVTISLPQSIINKINENAITKTMLFKTQAYFLCWLINRGDKIIGSKGFYNNTYQLHYRAHKKIITTSGQLEKVRDFLIEIELIKCVSNHSTDNNTAKVYSLNTPFNFKSKTNELVHFDTEIYGFAENFKNANYLILPENLSKKVDKLIKTWDSKEVKVNVIQASDNKELEQLKEENRQMKIELEQLKQLIIQGNINTVKEEKVAVEPEKLEADNIINEVSQPTEEEKIETNIDDDLMNKSLLVDDLEDLDFNEKVKSWDEQQALKEAEENKIFDLNKYKNNLSVELTENITNVVYRYTKSKSAVDKVIKIMNEKNIIEKSDLMCFGVSGAIVNMMFNDLQKIA
ncbi:hypothetical protein [Sphingobacterium sp. IITKGP-BTPF85]|uniref:hypothetical protein n=1 Tax=Sphingobacterium sp. IITKGP-BTPF85 TaxID=1338009 RepID=UPI000389EFCB|nr:hypothetical protein [Sphingobacterium sp. IITKGP-BTPF85]KKX48358.1 hypothetical protein L950_0221640 [Sphingobacterium sp. IITKGP-BTPF85]